MIHTVTLRQLWKSNMQSSSLARLMNKLGVARINEEFGDCSKEVRERLAILPADVLQMPIDVLTVLKHNGVYDCLGVLQIPGVVDNPEILAEIRCAKIDAEERRNDRTVGLLEELDAVDEPALKRQEKKLSQARRRFMWGRLLAWVRGDEYLKNVRKQYIREASRAELEYKQGTYATWKRYIDGAESSRAMFEDEMRAALEKILTKAGETKE